MAINKIPENKITLDQLLLNLASSGNEKHAKLASDLMDLNLVQGNASDNLGPNVSDKALVSENGDQNIEHELMLHGNVNLGPDCFDKISVSANKTVSWKTKH